VEKKPYSAPEMRPRRALLTDDRGWMNVPGSPTEIVRQRPDLVGRLPDSASPEVRALVQKCYDSHPAVRIGSIMGLTVLALKESRSHFEGKAQILGHMLRAISWREAEKNG